MAKKIGIYYDEQGLRNIMKGHNMSQLEQQIMMQKLSQVQAAFLQQFGFNGSFEIKAVTTNSRRSRVTYRIATADARTTAVLKRKPGWLGKFI